METPAELSPPLSVDRAENDRAENEWRLKVNANYQDVMKTLMNLVSASLVLPLFFVRNFLGVKPEESVAKHLGNSAYNSWYFLFMSLLCCMLFFWVSSKYVKTLCAITDKYKEKWRLTEWALMKSPLMRRLLGTKPEEYIEKFRDAAIAGAVGCFLAGLLCAAYFFKHLR